MFLVRLQFIEAPTSVLGLFSDFLIENVGKQMKYLNDEWYLSPKIIGVLSQEMFNDIRHLVTFL